MIHGELHSAGDLVWTPDGWYVFERTAGVIDTDPHYGLKRAGPFEIRDAHVTTTAERG